METWLSEENGIKTQNLKIKADSSKVQTFMTTEEDTMASKPQAL